MGARGGRIGERIRSWTCRARLLWDAIRRSLQGFVQQAWKSLLAGGRGSAALACGSDPAHSARICTASLEKAYWQSIVDMPRSLALGRDPAHSSSFQPEPVDWQASFSDSCTLVFLQFDLLFLAVS